MIASAARGEEQGADDEQPDADPERGVELGADAHVGRDDARAVGVHHDRAPVAVLGVPLERLLARSRREAAQNVSASGGADGALPVRRV